MTLKSVRVTGKMKALGIVLLLHPRSLAISIFHYKEPGVMRGRFIIFFAVFTACKILLKTQTVRTIGD